MFARTPAKRQSRKKSYRPRVERLETRLPFAVDGLSVSLDFGDVTEGLTPDEFTVNGPVLGATANPMLDGTHVFVFGEQGPGYFDIKARRTTADGNPGPLSIVLERITFTGTPEEAHQFHFASDGLSDNGLILSWTDGHSVFARRYDAAFSPVGSAIEVATAGTNTSIFENNEGFIDMQVTVFPGDAVGIAYVDPLIGNATLEVFDASLTTSTFSWQDATVRQPGESTPIFLTLRETGDGSFNLTWDTAFDTKPFEWALSTATFPDTATAPSSIDVFQVFDFVDPPQFARLPEGEFLLAGTRTVGNTLETIAQERDAQFNVVLETVLTTDHAIVADFNGIALQENNTYAVGYVITESANEGAYLQVFNSKSQKVGEAVKLSETPVEQPFHFGLLSLDTGGYAGYWAGEAINNNTGAVLTKTIRLEVTDLDITVHDENGVVNSAQDLVQIDGVPSDVGLNRGVRLSDTSWLVPLTDLSDLELLSVDEREPMQLSLQLVSGQSAAVLTATETAFGSEDDDVFLLESGLDVLNGQDGIDTLTILDVSQAYQLELLSQDQYRLFNNQVALDMLLNDVEFISFSDASFSIEAFLESQGESGSGDSGAGETGSGGSEQGNSNEGAGSSESVPPPPPPPAPPPPLALPPANPTLLGPKQESSSRGPQPLDKTSEATKPQSKLPAKSGDADADEASRESKESRSTSTKSSESGQKDSGGADSQVAMIESQELVAPFVNNPAERLLEAGITIATSESTEPIQYDNAPKGGQFQRQQLKIPPPQLAAQSNGMGNVQATNTAATLVLPPPPPPAQFPTEVLTVAPSFDAELLFESIDTLEEGIEEEQAIAEVVVGSAVVLATGFSIAHIAWLLRGSVLLTKLLSSMPIWISFDPLPMLREVQLDSPSSLPSESLADIVSNTP